MLPFDPTDARILEELQRDARLTNQDLAERVGLSAAPCWRRLKRLEEAGHISQYAAILDPENAGFSITAYSHVTLEKQHPDSLSIFNELVQDQPQVLECLMIAGQYDYLLKVVARTMRDYEEFLTKHLLPNPAVRSVSTSFVLRRLKYTTALPLLPTRA
jgi:Lrp/AsnC family leucine-responsive transcriptional regulator